MEEKPDKIDLYFADYAAYHKNPTNLWCHAIGIPLIVYHIIAMLDWVQLPHIGQLALTLGTIGYFAVLAWYMTLDLMLMPVMAIWFGAMLFLGRAMPHWVAYAAAALGWTTQLLGHLVWEKRSPAFLKNLPQALIGPLYFVDKLVKWKLALLSRVFTRLTKD